MKTNRSVFLLLAVAALLIIYLLDRSNRQWKAVQLDATQEMLAGAAGSGNIKKIRACLDAGANINGVRPTAPSTYSDPSAVPLSIAVAYHQEEATRYLLDHGANPNGAGRFPPLFQVIANPGVQKVPARLPIAKLLLERGADFNARNGYGETPLSNAKASEDPELVSLLQQYGAHH